MKPAAKSVHPSGEFETGLPKEIEADNYAGKLHAEWDPDADVTVKPLYGHPEDAKLGL
jgi:hypothetical protein